MASRKVTIFFNQDGKEIEIESSARTWGELRDQLHNYDLGNKKVVDRETRHVFEVDEAVLPEGEFVMYVYPKKSKGGAVPAAFKKMSPDKIHTYPFDTLRKFAKYLNENHEAGINLKSKKEEMSKELRKWMIKNSWPEAVAAFSPGKASKSSKKIEKELKDKIGGSSRTAQSSETAQQPARKPKKAGPASLDIIDDKLDIIIELLEAKAPRTAVPKEGTKKDYAEDAARLKSELHNI